jgi:putative addiction module killer protein
MRIDYGPGYRIYYVHRGAQIAILLCGGDKRTQRRDIKRLSDWQRHSDDQDDTI